MSETILTSKKYRILTDVAQKVWQRVSFWTKSSDVEFNDGKTAETKVGAISGITDSLVSNSSNIAASAKAVSELNGNLNNINVYVGEDGKLHFTDKEGADTVLNFKANPEVLSGASNWGNVTLTATKSGNATVIFSAGDSSKNFSCYVYHNDKWIAGNSSSGGESRILYERLENIQVAAGDKIYTQSDQQGVMTQLVVIVEPE